MGNCFMGVRNGSSKGASGIGSDQIKYTFGSSKQIEIIDTQICRNPKLVDQGILDILLLRIDITK